MATDPGRTIAELTKDPYPIYRQLRDEGSCVYLEAARRYVIPRWKDVFELDLNPAVTTREDNSLMTRAMGVTMRRTDGQTHVRLRGACQGVLHGRAFTSTWISVFRDVAHKLIDQLQTRGHAELVSDFATPFAARTLRLLLGIGDLDDRELDRASRAFIDGISNYDDDPDVWARCEWASWLVDDALERWWARAPEGTVLRAMIDSAAMSEQEIRANIKLFVAGALNEPRDLIASTVWAVLRDPVQASLVRADPGLLPAAMEETLRWLSPIGMAPRQVQADTVFGGVELAAGTPLGVLFASANRDERHWDHPDEFDLSRAARGHVAFGHGPYSCLGAFLTRRAVGAIALPAIFGRLPGLNLADGFEPQPRGWIFRGLEELEVTWPAA
jgi:cytochrome P450